MIVDLPYPHKALWPNGRAHWRTEAREAKKHKQWAHHAALAESPCAVPEDGAISINIKVFGKPRGVLPDEDNIVAAAKAYLDGIALRLGVNDRRFSAPTVTIAKARESRFVFTIGGTTAAPAEFPYDHQTVAEVEG